MCAAQRKRQSRARPASGRCRPARRPPGPRKRQGKLRIAEQFGVSYLPLHVIRDQGLIEKHGKAQGVDAAGAVDPLHLEDTNTYYRLQPDGTFAYAESCIPSAIKTKAAS